MSQTKAQLIDPVDGTIVNADINASAAIAGTKISPDFGTQGITTTGTGSSLGRLRISNVNPFIELVDTNNNSDFSIRGSSGNFVIRDDTNAASRLTINSSGTVDIAGNLDVGAGLDVTGDITATGHIDLPDASTIKLGDSDEFQIQHTAGGASLITETGSGNLEIRATNINLKDANQNNKLATNSLGVAITGNLDVSNGVDVTGAITGTGDLTLSSGGANRLQMTSPGGGVFLIKNPSAAALAFGANNAEKMRIDSSGLIRIHNTNMSANGVAQSLIVGTSGTAGDAYGISIFAGSSASANIFFGDSDGAQGDRRGTIRYFHGSDQFQINTAGNNLGLCVDASQRVGIGTSSPNTRLHVQGNQNNNEFEALRLHNNQTGSQTKTSIGFTNTTQSDYEHAKLVATRDNSGRLDFFVGAQSHAVLCVDGFASGVVGVNTVQASKALDVNGEIRTNSGILFGSDTAAANRLDDYEEGNWTPSIVRSGSNPTVSYTYRNGRYQKIGNMIWYWFDIQIASISGGSGGSRISLPFTHATGGGNNNAGHGVVIFRDSGAVQRFRASNSSSGFQQDHIFLHYIRESDQTEQSMDVGAGRLAGCGWAFVAAA